MNTLRRTLNNRLRCQSMGGVLERNNMVVTSKKVVQMQFFLFLLLSTTKSPNQYIYNKHKKSVKGKERKADWLGTSDLRKDLVVTSLGLLLASCLKLTGDKLATWKHQQEKTKMRGRGVNKCLQPQIWNSQSGKTKICSTIIVLLQPNTTQNIVAPLPPVPAKFGVGISVSVTKAA